MDASAPRGGGVRRLCGAARNRADRDWSVRRAGVCGVAPDEGNRHSHGARRRPRADCRVNRARGVTGGAAAGLALAVAATGLVRHMLYGSAGADWMSYAIAAVLVSMVGLLASLTPARRAAAVEPLVALRCD